MEMFWVDNRIFLLSNLVFYHQNKELILNISIDQSSPFPPGNYIITYRVTDENSGKSFDIKKECYCTIEMIENRTINFVDFIS
jgi:hypothetical protein